MAPLEEELFGKKYQGVEKRSTGYKLLAAMGWKEGEGLGASKQGIKEHVRVRKKADTIGVGLKEAAEHSKDWKIGMVAFDHVLSALKEVRAQHDKAAQGSHAADSDSSSSSSDEEDGAAAPAAPPPSRKRQAQKAAAEEAANNGKTKKKRKAACSTDVPAAGPPAPEKQKKKQKLQEAAAVPVIPAAKNPTHLGRFSRREAGKRVKGYSATDLAAILGGGGSRPAEPMHPAGSPQATHPAALSKEPAPSSDVSEETALEVEDDGGTCQPAEREASKWWTKLFSRAGKMGSRPVEIKNAPKPKVNVHGFSEQDQVDLYSMTHGGASKSKQGLGQASAPKKVAGTRWAGTKTKIEGSDSEPDQAEPAHEAEAEGDAAANTEEKVEPEMGVRSEAHSIVLPKSKQVAQQRVKKKKRIKSDSGAANVQASPGYPADQAVAASAAGSRAGKAIKWKKICKQALAAHPKRKMPHQKLLKQAAAVAGVDSPLRAEHLLQKLQASRQFAVCHKYVSLT